jgi:CRP-like cAMP-binding protein
MRALKDDVIFYKGTVGNQMYIVLGGKVGVFKGEKCLAELGTGDMFGEMALVNKEPRSATVKAIEASHLFVLSESTFQYLLTKRVAVQVLLNIVRTLSQRLKASAANTG